MPLLPDGRPSLTFSIKAFQELTHRVDPAAWPDVAERYLDGIAPLREAAPGLPAGRLEAVLFQFPYQFGYTPENRRYLGKLLDFFRGVPCTVEFRKADWYTERVIGGMKKREIPLAALDMPDLRGLPPLMDVVTSGTAYIRLHGRSKQPPPKVVALMGRPL